MDYGTMSRLPLSGKVCKTRENIQFIMQEELF